MQSTQPPPPPGFETMPNAGGDDLPEVPIDHLDFDFVKDCDDHKQLRDILAILESGKEGHYPELIQTTLDKLLSVMPAKEKKLFLALRSKPSAAAEDEAKSDLSAWIGEISKADAAVAQKAAARTTSGLENGNGNGNGGDESEIFGSPANRPAPGNAAASNRVPVRNSVGASLAPVVKQQLGSSTASLHSDVSQPKWTEAKPDPKSRDFKSYYDDWDKFDPDEAIGQLDQEEEAAQKKRLKLQQQQEARLQAEADARAVRMTELGISLDPTLMTEEEIKFTSEREKRKGNECFKANEFEDSILYYSRSIFVRPSNAVVWANRAMAYLRLKQFDKAEADCTEAIRLDPTYIKAISRRAMTRHKRGKYREAAKDYHMAVKLEPSNKTLHTLLQESRKKFTEVEGLALDADQNPVQPEKFKRIAISADDSSDEEDGGDDDGSDSDSDDNDMPTLSRPPPALPLVTPAPAVATSATGFKKVPIVEDDDSDDSDDSDSEAPDMQNPEATATTGQEKALSTKDKIIQDTLVNSSDTAASAVEKIRQRGNKFFAAGNLQLAISTYDQAIAMHPSPEPTAVAACYSNRAAAHLKMESFAFAERDSSSAIKLIADATDAKSQVLRLKVLYRRAVARKAQGKIAGAITDIRTVLSLQPQNSQAQGLLQEAEAEAAAREAESTASTLRAEEMQRQQALADKMQRQLDKAAKAARIKAEEQAEVPSDGIDTPLAHREMLAALRAAPPSTTEPEESDADKVKRAVVLKNQGNAAFKEQKYDSAIDLYSQAIELDPGNHVYYLNRAAAELAIEAEASWRHCISDATKVVNLVESSGVAGGSVRTKAIFRRASATEKIMALEWSRHKVVEALSNARTALADVQLALQTEPSHRLMLEMKARLEQKLKQYEAAQAGHDTASPSKLSTHAASKREAELKATALARRAQEARKKMAQDSPSKDFKAPRTAYAVKQALASLRTSDKPTERQAAYLWQFKTGSWTTKKLFSGGVDVEILGPLIQCLDLYFDESPKRCASILKKVAECKNSGTAAMLLSSSDTETLKRVQRRVAEIDPSAKIDF